MVGSANMDLVVRAARLPSPGDTVVGEDLVRVPGGKGANQAVAGARLGAATVFVGCVGTDAFGSELRAALLQDRVDVRWLRSVADRPSGVALIVVDARGENLIAVSPGANAALSIGDVRAALADLCADDVVLAQLEVPLEAVVAAMHCAQQAGAQFVLNAAPVQAAIREHLSGATTLIVNRGEAEALGGLEALAAPTVVVTLGGDGALVRSGGQETRIAPRRVDVVDTTAAGDAFSAAFAVALLEGQSPEAAAQFANIAGALATTTLGAQASLPHRAEVDSVS